MSKPKKWDTMTPDEQIAWKANRRKLQNNYRLKNLERCRENDRQRRLENAERSIAYWAKYKSKEKPINEEKEQKKREHKARLQKARYHANKEKALEIARKYRERKQRERKLDNQGKHRHRKYRAEIKAKEVELASKPVELNMSKVLAFINKKDGPKRITPNMAKVREFIKYA